MVKDFKTLKSMKLPSNINRKLRKEVKRWKEFIKEERGEIDLDDDGNDMHYWYHTGEISFIEFFFNLKKKNVKRRLKWTKQK